VEKIASFQVDHLRLQRGVFVSRQDRFGSTVITTFDLRLKEPNREPVMDISALHTLEHLGATFLRSHPHWSEKTVYFGPWVAVPVVTLSLREPCQAKGRTFGHKGAVRMDSGL